MDDKNKIDSRTQYSLSTERARNLATTTKTVPKMPGITPRWLLLLLPWINVSSGTYRLNKREKRAGDVKIREGTIRLPLRDDIEVLSAEDGEHVIPETYVEYAADPREYVLNLIQTILRINTRVADIYNDPIDQTREQLRLAIESVLERQEWELFNNKKFGLLHNVAPSMRIQTRSGPPTPDDMDELLTHVWKKPAFFLAHPKAIAAFGRECTKRGVPPATIRMFGASFLTWRGVPIIPTNKILVSEKQHPHEGAGRTQILLVRVGDKEQGVVGLHQVGPNQTLPSLHIRKMGIDVRGITSFLISLYFSIAVQVDDALGMLDNVEVGEYYEYSNRDFAHKK